MRQIHKLFNDYEIIQDTRFLKLTQDTVLLSDFVTLKGSESVFEFGVGMGNLSVLLLVKNSGITTNGIEILADAAEIARSNYENCGFSNRADVVVGDLKDYKYGSKKYDVCVSNPPYFAVSGGSVSKTDTLGTSRSDGAADIYDICAAAKRVLKWRGRLCFCYKPERIGGAFDALSKHNFSVKRIRFVHQSANKPANLVMIDASYGGGKGCVCESPLILS